MEEFFENELARKFEEMIENNDEFYFDTEEYIEIIIYYLELGDYSYAEMAVNHALKIHPNSLEVKTKQLEVFLELERYTKAKELLDELHQAGGDKGLRNRADAEARVGRHGPLGGHVGQPQAPFK